LLALKNKISILLRDREKEVNIMLKDVLEQELHDFEISAVELPELEELMAAGGTGSTGTGVCVGTCKGNPPN
jgi:hypothetical protein